ncbi:MAG TPA: hypothetical protein VI756_16340 [Blastocatellia bacterium]
MDFRSESHRRAYFKARDYLFELFGEVNVSAVNCALALQEGSTFVYIRAFPIGEDKAGVEIFAHVLADVAVTEELTRYLLSYNLKLVMGGFGLAVGKDGRGSVLLTHTILGDCMDPDELYASVTAIARVADSLDDQLVARFGGKTAMRKLGEIPPPSRWT